MSELAAAYYQERAERFGISEVPAVLSGDPVLLTKGLEPLSVHSPKPVDVARISDRLGALLASTHDFLLACTPDNPEYPVLDMSPLEKRNTTFESNFISKLVIPKALPTGRIDEIALEALAGSEVPQTALKRFKKSSIPSIEQDDDNGESTELYFGTTSQIKSGSRELSIGGLIVVRSVLYENRAMPRGRQQATCVHYGSIALNATETGERRSQGNRAYTIDATS